jgi:predicted metalloprotease with PDZ domain
MKQRKRLLPPATFFMRLVLGGFALTTAGHAATQNPTLSVRLDQNMVRTQISLVDRQAHLLRVETCIKDVTADEVDFSMPVWTPGSYLVREFARHVLDFTAHDSNGTRLPAAKLNKNTWRVNTAGSGEVCISYSLYANERSVRTSHVDADHAFLSPAGVFFRVSDRPDAAHAITIDAPAGWGVFTGLPNQQGSWIASNFDVLVDSPIEVGPHETLEFEFDGTPHRIVLAGTTDIDKEKMAEDISKIVSEVSSIFGQHPFEDYTFIISLVDSGGGGLEHLNSSVCMANRWDLENPDKYRNFLSLVAHEYFHAWNVKRFRPEALGPFDYNNEVYTRDLWVAEGITSYYDDLCTLRAGFYEKPAKYLEERAKAFKKEADRAGSRRMSMAESSHEAWIKLYRPDENSTNSTISYYTKGALVTLMLDLRIRRLSSGNHTLRDVLRKGWETYTVHGKGFPEGAVAELSSDVVGEEMADFFETYVNGTAALKPNDELRWVGLELKVQPDSSKSSLEKDADGFPLAAWLGMTTKSSNGLCRIDTVVEGGPAWLAGLNHDDLILAIGESRVTSSNLQNRLERAGPGSLEFTLYRGQSLRRIEVTPERRRLESWKIEPLENISDEQAAAYQEWLGSPHPAHGKSN